MFEGRRRAHLKRMRDYELEVECLDAVLVEIPLTEKAAERWSATYGLTADRVPVDVDDN